MLFLAIETSSDQGSLALLRDRDVVLEDLFGEGLTCVRDIAQHVRGALRSAGLGPGALEGIAVSVGPGSYTGVRVGVTAAKTLGFALRIPVVGVESMRVLAANPVLDVGVDSPPEPTLVAPILDGRQRFLYGSLFEVAAGGELPESVRELLPQTVDVADALCRSLSRRVEDERPDRPALVIGDGTAAFLKTAGGLGLAAAFAAGPREHRIPKARAVGLLAEPELRRAVWDREAVHRMEPLYLRVTEAERRLMEARPK